MSAQVISIVDYQGGWRPVRRACFYCGAVSVGSDHPTMPRSVECQDCGYMSQSVTHDVPGWENMTFEELEEAQWERV